ncbi:hypothetical protein ABZT03_32925 [Streptomyces sp. NPDC005574]|uniref:hypothetical protein n=1 Tax=Streptomyces sp. NPDC005574 TaxID=3156891 RepID=UPI0033B470AB
MAQQDRTEPGRETPEHRTSTVENGRFCTAHCTCGWRGPARRARSTARTDAESHTTLLPT